MAKQQNTDNLAHIISKARDGDTDAFETLYRHSADALFAYACARTGSRDDAMDLLQETFIDLWRALPAFTYHSDRAFIAFLFTILKRKLGRTYTLRHKYRQLLDALFHTHPQHYAESHEDYRHLHALLERLPARDREVLILRYWSSRSFAEIGDILGTNENNAKVIHHRACKKLETLCTQHPAYETQ